jgi:hypothetical protein
VGGHWLQLLKFKSVTILSGSITPMEFRVQESLIVMQLEPSLLPKRHTGLLWARSLTALSFYACAAQNFW